MSNTEDIAEVFERIQTAVADLEQGLWDLSAFDPHDVDKFVLDNVGYDNTLKWRDSIIEDWFTKLKG